MISIKEWESIIKHWDKKELTERLADWRKSVEIMRAVNSILSSDATLDSQIHHINKIYEDDIKSGRISSEIGFNIVHFFDSEWNNFSFRMDKERFEKRIYFTEIKETEWKIKLMEERLTKLN